MIDLQDSKIWPYIQDLIYSEVSYLDTVCQIEKLQTIVERSATEDAFLKQLQGSPDSDLKVMEIWIDRLKKLGVDFLTDSRIPDIRKNLLNGMVDQIEVQSTEECQNVSLTTRQADLDSIVTNNKELIDERKSQITELAIAECLWITKIK